MRQPEILDLQVDSGLDVHPRTGGRRRPGGAGDAHQRPGGEGWTSCTTRPPTATRRPASTGSRSRRGGEYVAFGTSSGGSERSTLRLLEVEPRRLLELEIPDTRAASIAWEPDGVRLLLHLATRRATSTTAGPPSRSRPPARTCWCGPIPTTPRRGPTWSSRPTACGCWSMSSAAGRASTSISTTGHSDRWLVIVEGDEATTRFTFSPRRNAAVSASRRSARRTAGLS